MLIDRLITAAAVVTLIAAGTAQAEFQLDPRYVDNDGDMIADIPTDESELVDPGTLIFAFTPVDIPLLTLGNGRLAVEQDTPIMIPLDTLAAESSFGHTLMLINFAYLPNLATA